ncbi:MAG: hypothetical protein ACRC7W_04590, partial [Fusobacteriaceae bacterium]
QPTQDFDEVDGIKQTFRQVFNTKKEVCDHIDEALKNKDKRKVKQEHVKFNVGVKVSVGIIGVDLSFGGERTRMYENERQELENAIDLAQR